MSVVAEPGDEAGERSSRSRGTSRSRAIGPGATPGGDRGRSLAPLATLLPYLARYRVRIACAFVALLVAAGATLVVPIAVREMIDNGFSADSPVSIDRYFLMMMGVVGVLAVASAVRYYLVTTLGERVVADLRTAVFGHVTALSAAFFDTARTGEVLSRLTADTTQIKSAVGSAVSQALRNAVLFIGAAAMMVVTSPMLSGLVLAAIPLIVLPLVAFGRAVRRRSREAQDTLASASAYATEAISSVRTLQAFTQEAPARQTFGAAVERAYAAAEASTRARAILTAVGIFLVFASVVTVLWIGANDVLAGTMSPGTLGQFVLFAVFAAGALGELSQVWGEIAQASGAAGRIAELLQVKPAVATPARPVPLPADGRGEVRFADVAFAYPTRSDADVLGGVNLAIRPGERVAIVGPSGAGKSTLFHLLLRFYDPTRGTVTLDGVDLTRADPVAVRARVALVPQDVAIFAASARDNIRFGRPDATDAEVERAAVLAQCDGFIARLPQGYETPIGERGVTLSGGERQRIAIARAILKDAPLLLLDEATSSLDAESETLVKEALDHLMEGRTTLVIAHRLATVQSADRILVMEGGRVVEEGTHDALVARDGLYARLARLQFQNGLTASASASQAGPTH